MENGRTIDFVALSTAYLNFHSQRRRFNLRPGDLLEGEPTAGQQRELIRFPVEGVDGGSISMLAVQIG